MADQLKPQEAKPEHASPETRDKPASRIASRDLPEYKEAAWKRKKERSWLPSNEKSQVAVSLDALFTAINASYHIVPGKVDGIAAAALEDKEWWEYLDQIWDAAEAAERTSLTVLPALMLRAHKQSAARDGNA